MSAFTYFFSDKHCEWEDSLGDAKQFLGGKGAGLVKMAQAGFALPPGFTIPTVICKVLETKPDQSFIDELMEAADKAMVQVRDYFGYVPLVAVRSGAPVSMPGMMDTILNVGLTKATMPFWIKKLGARAAWDSRRRLIQMLGQTAFGVPMAVFDELLNNVKVEQNVELDTELDTDDLIDVVGHYLKRFEQIKGFPFPDTVKAQLHAAISAVFDSWQNPRAIEYRKINKIDPSMGTACTVQAMVFGNTGDESGTGVLFTRNPLTGENKMFGEYLPNAQGEDVVAGIRTPLNVHDMEVADGCWPAIHGKLMTVCEELEVMYGDMVDLEFTVQDGQLFILQSRTGKRSAAAAFQIAVDMVDEGSLLIPDALKRLTVEQFKTVRRPMIDPKFKTAASATGMPACPGVVTGRPVYSSDEAVKAKDAVILVTHETNPNDIAGMAAAVGILTQTGGATSHAAVVARAMDKTCVTGCTQLDIKAMQSMKVQKITIDGSTGKVWIGTDVPVIDSSDNPAVKQVMEWCMHSMDAVEAVPADLGMERPHWIMASHWWGDTKAAWAVVECLKHLPSRKHIKFCTTAPWQLTKQADFALLACFGTDWRDTDFAGYLQGLLKEAAFDDLAVVDSEAATKMSAVQPDYAAFTVLGQ